MENVPQELIVPQATKYALNSKEFIIGVCVVVSTLLFNFTPLELPEELIEIVHGLNWEKWDTALTALVFAVIRYYFTGSKIIGLINPDSKLGKLLGPLLGRQLEPTQSK